VRRVSYPDQGLVQTSQGPNVLFRDQVSRNTALRFGYGYQQIRTSSDGRLIRVHNIDVGADYTRALGETRRTTMGFEVGSALYNQDQSRYYRVNGGAWLRREIGRSWSATMRYHRGLGMLDGFSHPYFADSWSAAGGGFFTRKLELRLNAAYTMGDLELVSRGGQFSTGNGSAMMRYGITQLLAVYGEYDAYRYRFEQTAVLPSGLPPVFLRHSIRSGLTLLLPLFR
jgi:hypothetical protein